MFIRTVLGDIDPGDFGPCDAHDHVTTRSGFPTYVAPEFLLEDFDAIVTEVSAFHDSGGRAIVDAMPCDTGRDPAWLAEISRRTGVHIVASTGLHLETYYPPRHWGERLDEAELSELFVREIEEGIDELDYSAPVVRRTEYRAGAIKVAGGADRLSERQRRAFRAAARASAATGAPILTHTEGGTAALEQVEILTAAGADPRHVVICHVDRIPDLSYHREILSTGVRVEYDSGIRWPAEAGNPTADLIAELLPEFPDQITIGMDAAKQKYWRSYGGAPGLRFLMTAHLEMLRERGVSEELIHGMLVTTPADAYSFRGPQESDR